MNIDNVISSPILFLEQRTPFSCIFNRYYTWQYRIRNQGVKLVKSGEDSWSLQLSSWVVLWKLWSSYLLKRTSKLSRLVISCGCVKMGVTTNYGRPYLLWTLAGGARPAAIGTRDSSCDLCVYPLAFACLIQLSVLCLSCVLSQEWFNVMEPTTKLGYKC